MSESLENRLQALEAQVRELKDREAIREVIHRYCQAVDRCDLDMLKSCYHADGYDDHGFFAGNAHEFAEYVIPCLARIDSSMHSITNTRFKFDGNRRIVFGENDRIPKGPLSRCIAAALTYRSERKARR